MSQSAAGRVRKFEVSNNPSSPRIRYNTVSLKNLNPTRTEEGFWRFSNVKIARTGAFDWAVRELEDDGIYDYFPDLHSNDIVQIQRDTISESAVNSLSLKPLTNNHPVSMLVTPSNAKSEVVGAIGAESFLEDGWLIAKDIIVYDEDSLNDLQNGKVEVSIGYTYEPTTFVKDLPYVAKEDIIYINHVAIVSRGRAGSECRFNQERELLMENEALHQLQGSVETLQSSVNELKDMYSMTYSRLNAAEEKLKEIEAIGDRINESVSQDTAKSEEEKRKNKSADKKSDAGSSCDSDTDNCDRGEDDNREKEKNCEKTDEKGRENAMSQEQVIEYARKNDIFMTDRLSMQELLKSVPTNGLIGFVDGKPFEPMSTTRINDSMLVEMAREEIKRREEAVKEARSNEAPEDGSDDEELTQLFNV